MRWFLTLVLCGFAMGKNPCAPPNICNNNGGGISQGRLHSAYIEAISPDDDPGPPWRCIYGPAYFQNRRGSVSILSVGRICVRSWAPIHITQIVTGSVIVWGDDGYIHMFVLQADPTY